MVSTVPPPWTLHGEAHALLVWMPSAAGAREEFAPKSQTATPSGTALMLFVRYTDSPVGPYDELLWVSLGRRRRAARGWGDAGRHTVIHAFVSTPASAVSGRANWGIPKRLAEFEVETRSALALEVRVSTEGRSVAAFVVEGATRGFPFGSRPVPAFLRTLVQELDGRRYSVVPHAKGRLAFSRFSTLAIDPAEFPDARRGHRLASASLRDFEMRFPEARIEPLPAR